MAAAAGPPARDSLVIFSLDELGSLLVDQHPERFIEDLPHQIRYVLAQRFLVGCYDVRKHGPNPIRQ